MEGGKPRNPEKNPQSKTRINNKLNPHARDTRSESNPGHLRFNSFTRMTGQFNGLRHFPPSSRRRRIPVAGRIQAFASSRFSPQFCIEACEAKQSVIKRKRSCFAPDTAIVHTTTPKTITENGVIQKRSPAWSDLKTMLFENAVF